MVTVCNKYDYKHKWMLNKIKKQYQLNIDFIFQENVTNAQNGVTMCNKW